MLYLGHFSFNLNMPEPVAGPWHGLFTCVVEAPDVEAAYERFERLIRAMAKHHDLLEDVRDIYLDACVELESLPAEGLMSFITLRVGPDVGGITGVLPGAPVKGAAAYRSEMDEEDGTSGGGRLEPFVRLRPRRKARPRKTSKPPDRVH